MGGYISRILSTSVSGINAQQARIAAAANNIANVDTDGYVRRTVDLSVNKSSSLGAGGVNVGNGVDVSGLIRQSSKYLEKLLRESNGDFQAASVLDEYLDRVESLFSLDKDQVTIGTALNNFFSAAGDLAMNPANSELRATFLTRAQELCASINNTYDTIASLQIETDDRIATEIETLNSITSQIANLNSLIKGKEAAGNTVAADERDERDQLLVKLSQKMDVNITEISDGSINVTLANGFSLVAGTTSNELSFVYNVGPGQEPKSLAGTSLRYIVADYSNDGSEVVNLTDIIGRGNGSIGGLLQVRGVYPTSDDTGSSAFNGEGLLIECASRIEAITRTLLKNVNQTYYAADYAGNSTAGDLNGNPPNLFGLFTTPNMFDADGDNQIEDSDFESVLVNNGYGNFSSILKVAITDVSKIAAARADSTASTPYTFSSGNGKNMEALLNEQLKKRNFSLGSYSFTGATISGAYDELVSKVGNLKNTTRVNLAVSEAGVSIAQERRDECSAVSLDEEFVSLVKYQRAYQASARLVKIADQLLEEVINTI